jgi:hypothetical protein
MISDGRRKTYWAMGLWLLLAVVVFNVRFDWQTRTANRAFVQSQLARRQQGQPLLTINDGFRPMVRQAARDSSVWLILISVGGTVAVAAAHGKSYTRPAARGKSR